MNVLFKLFSTLNRYLLFFEKSFMCILLFSMIILSFGQVVARNAFSSGFIWIDQVLRVEVLWVTFVGASLATEYGQHIKIDFLTNVIHSNKTIKIIHTCSQVFALAVCILLFSVAAEYISIVSADTTSTLINGIADWVLKLVIPYCFFVMILRCVMNIMRLFIEAHPGFSNSKSVK